MLLIHYSIFHPVLFIFLYTWNQHTYMYVDKPEHANESGSPRQYWRQTIHQPVFLGVVQNYLNTAWKMWIPNLYTSANPWLKIKQSGEDQIFIIIFLSKVTTSPDTTAFVILPRHKLSNVQIRYSDFRKRPR